MYKVIIGKVEKQHYIVVFQKKVDSYNSALRLLNEILKELGPEYSGRIERCSDDFCEEELYE